MPSTKGMELLVRKNQPTAEEWLALLEARRSFMKPRFDRYTLPELGSLDPFSDITICTHQAIRDQEIHTEYEINLETQGVFGASIASSKELDAYWVREQTNDPYSWRDEILCKKLGELKGDIYIWGLTRDAEWVLYWAPFRLKWSEKSGLWSSNVTPMKSSLRENSHDLQSLLERAEVSPREIWEKLGQAVKQWTLNRKRLWDEAQKDALIIEAEELALSGIDKSA